MVSFSCGVIANFIEMPRSESLAIAKQSLIDTNLLAGTAQLRFAIYDDGCHLDSSIKADSKKGLTKLQDLKVCIDRMHINNHKKQRCKKIYCCDNYPELQQLNSQVCEQQFFLLSQYKHMTKHMPKHNFLFFFFVIFDLMNDRKFKNSL